MKAKCIIDNIMSAIMTIHQASDPYLQQKELVKGYENLVKHQRVVQLSKKNSWEVEIYCQKFRS